MAAKRAIKRKQVAERRNQAIELRKQGRTFDEIAKALGYKTRSAAAQDVQRAMRQAVQQTNEAANELRQLELDRLDHLWREAWDVMQRPHLLVQGGKPVVVEVEDDDGTVKTIRLQDDSPKLAAIQQLLRISERRARLLGIDQQVHIEAAGVSVRYEIVGVDMEALQ